MKNVFLGIAALVVIAVLAWSAGAPDRKAWNDGICTECGGNYEFDYMRTHSSYLEYRWTCDSCGHTIWTETDFR